MFRDRVLLALVAVGAVARFATLDVQSFWFDEALTVKLVNDSFGDMISGVFDGQAQPPPYFVAAWAWVKVFGDGEAGLRSLSALFGVLTIPVVWATAIAVAGRRVAIVATLLTALSPPLIWYSQEARGYSLVVLCAALSLLFFVRSLETPGRRNLALWVAASLAAVASHYFALFTVLPEAAWLLWRLWQLDRPRALRYGGILGAGLLVLAPMLLYQREHGGAEWIAGEDFWPRLRDTAVFFVGGPQVPGPLQDRRALVAVVTVLVFLVVVAAAVRAVNGPARPRFLAVLGVGLATLALPLLAAAAGSDFVLDRNFIAAWVPLTIAVAAGLCLTPLRVAGAAIGALTVALFVAVGVRVAQDDHLQRDDWRTVAEQLGPTTPDRVIEAVPHWQMEALGIYAPELAPMRAPRPVSRLVLVSYIGFLPHNQPVQPIPPPPPFRETRRTQIENVAVVEYAAPEPVVLDPKALTGTGINQPRPYAVPMG